MKYWDKPGYQHICNAKRDPYNSLCVNVEFVNGDRVSVDMTRVSQLFDDAWKGGVALDYRVYVGKFALKIEFCEKIIEVPWDVIRASTDKRFAHHLEG